MAAGNAGGTAIVIKSNASIAIFVKAMPREIYEELKKGFIIYYIKSSAINIKYVQRHLIFQQLPLR